ncbi:hypothetical protein [Chryseobacterium sp.]|uniref:hypothetical protein n=1 Tax=Chryseobacterium sp. TaxID=1871047 RepID=UPI00289AF2F3|nr:hypothetical protein [Chryseobacterium sp.]
MDKENKNIFEKLTELVGAFQIFLSPFLAGLILAVIFYLIFPEQFGIYISCGIVFLSLLTGILLAKKIYKSKSGTIHFISRVNASPELDGSNDNESK